MSGRAVRGFLTEEIRIRGQRVGFHIESLDGQLATLAHVDFQSSYHVGRYRVDVETLEGIVDSSLALDRQVEVYLVDEIGKMECLSEKFVTALTKLLDSGPPVVATVARQGGGFIAGVKRRPDVELHEVTRQNRDEMPDTILKWLAGASG